MAELVADLHQRQFVVGVCPGGFEGLDVFVVAQGVLPGFFVVNVLQARGEVLREGVFAGDQAAFADDVVEDERVRGDVLDEPGGAAGDVVQVVDERRLFGEHGDVAAAPADGGEEVEQAAEAVPAVLLAVFEQGGQDVVEVFLGALRQAVPVGVATVLGEARGNGFAGGGVGQGLFEPARKARVVRVAPVDVAQAVVAGLVGGGVVVFGNGAVVVLVDGVAGGADLCLQAGSVRRAAGQRQALPGGFVLRQLVGLLFVFVLEGVFDAAQGEVGLSQGGGLFAAPQAALANAGEGFEVVRGL